MEVKKDNRRLTDGGAYMTSAKRSPFPVFRSPFSVFRSPFSVLFLLFFSFTVSAQTVIMPAVGTGDTTMSYALVYDDGGPNGNYSSQCNATYTFHTVNPNGCYRIIVRSQLTNPAGSALLTVYDGVMAMPLGSYFSGSGADTFMFYSTINAVTLTFTADDDSPTAGFEVELCEFNACATTIVNYSTIDSNTLVFEWTELDTTTVWYFDFAILPDSVRNVLDLSAFFDTGSYTTRVLYSPTTTVGGIPVGWGVVYRLTSNCSSPCSPEYNGSGGPSVYICDCVIPTSYTMVPLQDSIRIQWTTDTVVSHWHVWDVSGTFDTILPGTDTQFTFYYEYTCYGGMVYINGNCNSTCRLTQILLPVGGCHALVGYINKTAATSHSITVSWVGVSDPGARYLLYYRPSGSSVLNNILVDTLPYNVHSYTYENLLPATRYTLTIWVLCSDSTFACDWTTVDYYTCLDNCIDFTNIYDNPAVHCAYGSYDSPGQSPSTMGGRHTPIGDSSLRDARTGYMLRCVPPGEEASFRLGDANTSAQGETVTYDYLVDTTDKDMLVLRYAVVMQNPNHTAENQPHFTMEILDTADAIIDTTCCYADFYAAGDPGWNTVAGTNVIWKDWTTVGIDLAPYHGQNIRIRFTTKDCADGGHFGYAYFTLHCDSKHIALVNLCDHNDSVRLRAPEGFEYRWTHGDDTTVISTQNEILVVADSSEYHCHASFIGKPECSFSVHSIAIIPQLHAELGYTIDTCAQTILLTNRSTILIDSIWRPYVTQTIDSVHWVVNGDTVFADQLLLEPDTNTTLHIALYCQLSGSLCFGSDSLDLIVDFVHSRSIVGDTLVCPGDTVVLLASEQSVGGSSLLWDDSTTAALRTVTVNGDTTFSLIVSYLHCLDTHYHHVATLPVYADTIVAVHCANDTALANYSQYGISTTQSGIYTLQLQTVNQCDSLVTLDLTIHPVYSDTLRVATCDEPFSDGVFVADTTGFYTQAYLSVFGCDSLRHLDFLRRDIFHDTIEEQILFGDTYDAYGFYENTTGVYTVTYTDQNGCDSIYTLDLDVVYIQFPNAVTPNGDGYNDRFVIVNLLDANIFDYTSLWIYDRWGKLIYRKENISTLDDFWDPNETRSPDGTYFFRFFGRTLSHEVNHKGVIEVLR